MKQIEGYKICPNKSIAIVYTFERAADLNCLTRSPLMKIEIQSIKITIKWWQLAMVIAVAILCFKAPEVITKLLQIYFSSR